MAGGSAAANVTAAVGAIHDVASVDLVVPFLCLALACGAVLQQVRSLCCIDRGVSTTHTILAFLMCTP